jgi:hypothetical protein
MKNVMKAYTTGLVNNHSLAIATLTPKGLNIPKVTKLVFGSAT